MPACGWDVIGCGECAPYSSLDEAAKAEVDAWAVNRLWEWTNQRFGPCDVTYTHESPGCCDLMQQFPCKRNEILLPGPIAEPVMIVIDGESVDTSSFRVEDWAYLVRIDGGDWGREWTVTYAKGEPVPPGAGLVAGVLACEYAKSVCNDSSCRLPKRVAQITRQQVTVALLDNFTNLKEGFTGIWEIDDFVMTNQTNLRIGPWKMGRVSSPDLVQRREITWEYAGS